MRHAPIIGPEGEEVQGCTLALKESAHWDPRALLLLSLSAIQMICRLDRLKQLIL